MNALIIADKWLTKLLEWLLVALFFGFFFMVCVLVVLRYGFGDTIVGGNEGVTVAFVFTVAIGAAVAITRREHIAITFFRPDTRRPDQCRHDQVFDRLDHAHGGGAMAAFPNSSRVFPERHTDRLRPGDILLLRQNRPHVGGPGIGRTLLDAGRLMPFPEKFSTKRGR
jgi:hypothetical protein